MSSIPQKPLRLQIGPNLTRPALTPEDAGYWAQRARKLFPDAKIAIVHQDGSKYEVAK